LIKDLVSSTVLLNKTLDILLHSGGKVLPGLGTTEGNVPSVIAI